METPKAGILNTYYSKIQRKSDSLIGLLFDVEIGHKIVLCCRCYSLFSHIPNPATPVQYSTDKFCFVVVTLIDLCFLFTVHPQRCWLTTLFVYKNKSNNFLVCLKFLLLFRITQVTPWEKGPCIEWVRNTSVVGCVLHPPPREGWA